MKAIKNQKGMITIEASISFIVFMFLILFIYSFGGVYVAQNIISHATIQATQTIAMEAYGREKMGEDELMEDLRNTSSDLSSIANSLFGSNVDLETTLFNDFQPINDLTESGLKKVFVKAWKEALSDRSITGNKEEFIQKLENAGLDPDDIEFNVSVEKAAAGEGYDIVAVVKYDVNLQFPFMGKDKVGKITKQSRSKLYCAEASQKEVSWTGID